MKTEHDDEQAVADHDDGRHADHRYRYCPSCIAERSREHRLARVERRQPVRELANPEQPRLV